MYLLIVFVYLCGWGVCTHAFTSVPSVVAHRGASGLAPENTMPAFQLAVEQGANGLEVDVQMTLDGQLVVLHDHTLDRTTNCTGNIANLTWDQVKDCDASYNFPQFAGTGIPLLSDVISLAIKSNVFVVLDYKSSTLFGSTLAQLLNDTNQLNQKFRLIGSCWYPNQALDFAVNLPGCPRQYLTSGVNYQMDGFWQAVLAAGANGFSIQYTNITKDFVTESHAKLLSVVVWTVNSAADMQNAISFGVDGIITDYPLLLVSEIQKFNAVLKTDNGVKTWVIAVVAIGVFVLTLISAMIGMQHFKKKTYSKIYQ